MNFNTITAYQRGSYPFPMDQIDPSKKDEEWGQKWCQAMYAAWVTDRTGVPFSQLDELYNLRRYGSGNQDVGKYQKILLEENEEDGKLEGYMNINWEIFSVAPKFKYVVTGMFEQQDHNIVATAVDPSSSKLKEKAKFLKWFKGKFRDKLQQIEAAMGDLSNEKEYLPESVEELNLYSQMGGFKLGKEMEIEEGLNYTFYISDWKETKRKIFHDLMDINSSGVKDFVDQYTRKVKTRYVDPCNFIIQYSRHWDHRNSEYAGEVIKETISNIRKLTGYDEQELRNLAQFYNGRNGNQNLSSWTEEDLRINTGGWKYDNFLIDVLDAEWFSVNDKYYSKRKTKHGETFMYEEKWGKELNTETKMTEVKRFKVVYRCKWIVGTDWVYDFGLQYDVPRPGKKEVELSYSFYKLPGRSLVSLMVPMLDQMQLTWLKLQNALAMASPSGLAIEYTALNNMSLGGKKMQPLDILSIKRDTGDLIYKATTHRGQMNVPAGFRPIQELEGGIGNQLGEFIQILDLNLNLIRDLTGINQIADASNPNPEQSVGGSELAVAATNNALRPIYAGYIRLKEFTAKKCALRIQLLVRHDKKAYEGYIPVVGAVGVKMLSVGADVVDANYFIKIEAKPTEQHKDKIRQAAMAAMNPSRDGHIAIEYSDYLFIERALDDGNLKFAEAYLNYKSSLSKRESEQRADKLKEIEGKNAQELARVKEEETRKTREHENELEKGLESHKEEEKRQTAREEHDMKMDEIRLEKSLEPTADEADTNK